MKTNLRKVSKRTLALFLGVLMLITSIGFGTIITADAATYYLHYNNQGSDNPSGYTSSVTLTSKDGNYYTGSLSSNDSKNLYFLINNSSTNHSTSLFNSSTSAEFKGSSITYHELGEYSGVHIAKLYAGKNTIYVGYNVSKNSLIISTNQSDVTDGESGGGGGGDTTSKWYIHGSFNSWENGTEMNHCYSDKDYWYYYNTSTSLEFKLTKSATGYDGELNNTNISSTSPITLGNNNGNITLNKIAYVVTDGTWVWATTENPDHSSTQPTTATETTLPTLQPDKLQMDDYNLEHTWINATGAGVDEQYLYTNVTDIALKKSHSDSGYSYYVPVAYLKATKGSSDAYFYGAAKAEDKAGTKITDFSVKVGNLSEDVYDVSVSVLAFKTLSEANAVANHAKSSALVKGNGVLADNGVFFHDANRMLTVSNDTPHASLTARLSVNGTAEGSTLTLNNDATETLTLTGSCNNGNTAVNTQSKTIEKNSAKSYRYEYYYFKNTSISDLTTGKSNAVLVKTAYDTNPSSVKPVTSNTATMTLGDVEGLKDGDVLHFYVLITAYSDAGHTNAITERNSSEEKGIINVSISSISDKQSAVTGSSDLWIDTAPQYKSSTDTSTVIKWNHRTGTGNSTTTTYYFYLPKNDYVKLSNLVFYYDNSKITNVKIGSTPITSGEVCTTAFSANTNYTVSYTNVGGSSTSKTVRFMQGSEDVAQLYLNTPKDILQGTDPSVTDAASAAAQKATTEMKGNSATSISADGTVDIQASAIKKIKGRGNSSWEASARLFGKYAYNLNLNDKVNLLGLAGDGKNKKYCLLANDLDSTQARNAYIFNLAKAMGLDYTPNYQMVDLYNNGNYLGSYLVTQKVELGKNSLVTEEEIEQDDVGGTETTNVGKTMAWYEGTPTAANYKTGTYMLEFEVPDRYQAEVSYFTSGQGQNIVVTSPEYATKKEVEFIKGKWDAVEKAVYEHRLDDVRDNIDVESFAKVYLIQELSKNLDSCATSYDLLYKASEGKFYAQPVWDYDWALGNYDSSKTGGKKLYGTHTYANADTEDVHGFFARYKAMGDGTQNSKYNFQAMLCDNESFWSDVYNIWTDESGSKTVSFRTESINSVNYVKNYLTSIEASVAMNETRWGHIALNNRSGSNTPQEWGTASGQGSTFTAVSNYLTTWITNRSNSLHSSSTNGNISGTRSSNSRFDVAVATNYENATVKIEAAGLDTVESNSSSFTTNNTVNVAEYSYVTFSTKASDNSKEFKGWFTTSNPLTTGNSGKGYNAVSMEETFSAVIRSNVKIYALYSDEQDESKGGIVSGDVFYYSAPKVNLDIKGKDGTSITEASIGDTITLEAEIPEDGESVYYKDRVKQDTKLQYLYNFYEIEKNGKRHLLDSQTGSAATKSTDPRLTCTTTTTFSEISTYCVEAYCVYVDPDESPFSVGLSEEKTIKSDTVTNTENITIYIDFDKYNIKDSSSAGIVVTDINDIEKNYGLVKLGSSTSSNIYVAENVAVAYTTKNNVNTLKSDFVSINVDGQVISIDDADQPDLSLLLEHKVMWYKANNDSLETNITQSHYVVNGQMGSDYKNSSNYRPYTSRTQSSELSTKRIYLTNNRNDDNIKDPWEGFNIVYTLDKAVSMKTTNYSTNTNYIWFQKKMTLGGTNDVNSGQGVLYVDIPYNVTAYYFEDSSMQSTKKAEVHYVNDSKSNDTSYIDEANAYYFDSSTKVRMWPEHNWPGTPDITRHISDLYVVKGEKLSIVPTYENADHGLSYTVDDNNVAVVSTAGMLTAKDAGTTTVTITPSGTVNNIAIDGISETVNVTVIDKDNLKKMVAEAEYIIGERNKANPDFTNFSHNSYAAFEIVYNTAIDVYNRSLYSQEEIDMYTDLLRSAMENIRTENKVGTDENEFDLIAYNSSDVKIISDGNGKVGEPTISPYTHKVNGALGEVGVENEVIKPYITEIENGYQILYAEGFGFTSTAQEVYSEFISWTIDGDDNASDNETLSVETAKPAQTTYIAKFGEPVYTLNLKYKFKDFDVEKAGTYEYNEKGLKDEYSIYELNTTISIEEALAAQEALNGGDISKISDTVVTELSRECTPDVISSYYTYYYPSEISIGSSGNYQLSFDDANKTADLTVTLGQKPREYSIYVNGSLVGDKYHYQEQVTLNAEDYLGAGSDGQKYKWWIADSNEMEISLAADDGENILSLQKEFTVRALEDELNYKVAVASEEDSIDKTSVISPAYTEIIYRNNEKRIQQNFYIQNNLEERSDLQAAGNIFYYWNDLTNQPVDRNLKQFNKNTGITTESLKNLINSNYQDWEAKAKSASNNKDTGTISNAGRDTGLSYTYYYKPEDQSITDGLLRYSTANKCWSYIFAVNSADNYEKYENYSYRVHSFFILKESAGSERIIVSDTYAQAKVYVNTVG